MSYGTVTNGSRHLASNRRFEASAVRPDGIDDYFWLPNGSFQLDVTASRGGFATALAFGDSLFKALEDRGHRIVIAGAFQELARISIDGDEKSREDLRAAARRPSVVYVGTIPIGLGPPKKCSPDTASSFHRTSGRHVGYTWSNVKQMPSRRIAYDPSRRAEWRQSGWNRKPANWPGASTRSQGGSRKPQQAGGNRVAEPVHGSR